MKLKLTLSFDVIITVPGANINEIFVGIDEGLKEVGPEIAAAVLEEVQEETVTRIQKGEWTGKELGHKTPEGKTCPGGGWEKAGLRPRTMKGALGHRAAFSLQQMKCGRCGKHVRVLLPILDVEKWQRHTGELEKAVSTEVCKQSYRWGIETLEQTGGVPVPRSSAHRWVIQGDLGGLMSDPQGGEEAVGMMIDGTGLKRQGKDWKRQVAHTGKKNEEIRVVVGVTKGGDLIPFGTWTDLGWDEIAEEVRKKVGEEWQADYVLADGEKGLLESFEEFGKESGRCEWHLVRNLGHTLWQEEIPKEKRSVYQEELQNLIGIELPEEDFEHIDEETKAEIKEKLKRNEEAYKNLVETFEKKGLKKPAAYLRRAMGKIFTNIKIWLSLGYISPTTISILERLMRVINRRMKSIGARWSNEGAGKIAGLLLKRIYQRKEWDRYWREKLDLQGRFRMNLTSVQVEPVCVT